MRESRAPYSVYGCGPTFLILRDEDTGNHGTYANRRVATPDSDVRYFYLAFVAVGNSYRIRTGSLDAYEDGARFQAVFTEPFLVGR